MGSFVPANLPANLIALGVGFIFLTKSADALVEGAVGVARHFHIPKVIIGIVLVSFATTAPEIFVSLSAALKGSPSIALGNAVGSVIVDDTVALPLGILVAPTVILIDKHILRASGILLMVAVGLTSLLVVDGEVKRWEGASLLCLLAVYMVMLVRVIRKNGKKRVISLPEEGQSTMSLTKMSFLCGVGLGGLFVGSELLVNAVLFIAHSFQVAEGVIGLTVVAIGTSLPEMATCIAAAKAGHGDIAFGDIIGADLLNLLWIIGATSLIKPIIVEPKLIFFAFPVMIVIVGMMLLLARKNYRLESWKGILLLLLYGGYLGGGALLFF